MSYYIILDGVIKISYKTKNSAVSAVRRYKTLGRKAVVYKEPKK